MEHIDKVKAIENVYRHNPSVASTLKSAIQRYAEKLAEKHGSNFTVKIMNFCGTHEWTTTHFGIRSLMPKNVELIAGPGCPVCITPSFYVEATLKLASEGITIYTYGDAFKLPAIRAVDGARSLSEAKAGGRSVKVSYSFLDAVKAASADGRESVFLGIGFETTVPSYASLMVAGKIPRNLKFLSALRLTPPAALYAIEHVGNVSGVVLPGHVSTIIGAAPWVPLSERFKIPGVVSGFEPIDLIIAVAEILKQLVNDEAKTVIEYTRAVTWEGNKKAQNLVSQVTQVGEAAWRGLGFIPDSGLYLSEDYAALDALAAYGIREPTKKEWSYDLPRDCRCADITLGRAKPTDCSLFTTRCTPETPWGPCMVSSEGTCAVWARFGGGGLAEEVASEIGED